MAKVSLRIYNQEIGSMVERGQLDEAIAHCRHVLNAFPKNLETYRLLGKSYLESKRYNEATDIFARVLMAVPDDFVTHVGMSIINDERKNMDAAIWHMQRAFEVQPSNTAIQSELQRLYGRRDGVEPPKIRLTRGALAHMYVQGELHPQAISEINGVLEEDPNRQDMQVLLARAYFHAGQNSEAAEICSQLLRRYPYCFDANRVLVELLPQTEGGESTQAYRRRITELDPYSSFVTGSVFHSDEVADAAVNLDRLDWDGKSIGMQPEWSDSLGIGKGESVAAGSDQPDWLKAEQTDGTPAASIPTASTPTGEPAPVSGSLPIPTANGDDEIPGFLREAGWGEDTGAFQEGSGSLEATDETPAEPIAEGELPSWAQAMAPSGADQENAAPQTEPMEDLTKDDVPDWLQGVGNAQDAQSAAPAEKPSATEEDLPDRLGSAQPEEQAKPNEIPQEPAQEIPAVADAPPSDLQAADEAPSPQEQPAVAEEPAQPVEEAAPPAEPVSADDLGTSAEEQDEAVAWLENLASKHGAKPEELVTDPEARQETAPDWVQEAQAAEEQAGAEAPVAQEQPAVAEEPAQPVEEAAPPAEPVSADDLGTSAEEQDETVAWLEGLASEHGAKPEELVTDPEARQETAPDWVQKAAKTGADQPPAEESAPAESDPDLMEQAKELSESLYSELEESQTKEPLPSDTDETGMWLRDLVQDTGIADDQTVELTAETEAGPEAASEADPEKPDWLHSLEGDPSGANDVAASAKDAEVDDLPSWLDGLDDDQEQSDAPDGNMPDWLSSETEQESAQPEPTALADWQPTDIAVEPEPVEESPAPAPPPPVPAEQEPTPKSEAEPEPAAQPENEAQREPVTASRSGMTGILSPAQNPLLVQAQDELKRSNILAAMEDYGKLIKKSKMLDEVIFDLREAMYRYPVEVLILQTLGDAYMRANRLQDALDSYTKAEELLR